MKHSEPHQIDLEEYIAEKTGQPMKRQPYFGGSRERGTLERENMQPLTVSDDLNYIPLREVLTMAYNQSAFGKGRDRHSNGQPFMQQPIMEIGRMVGIGYQIGQAMKKSQEATGMIDRGQFDAAKAEFLGAINYLAAAYLLTEEMKQKETSAVRTAREKTYMGESDE